MTTSIRLIFSFLVFFSSFVAFAKPGVEIMVTLNPMGSFKMTNLPVKGSVKKTAKGLEAQNLVVDFRDLKTGLSLRDRHAKEKYIEVQKYPEATLSAAFGNGGKGKGKLKFRGFELDIQGTYVVEGNEVIAQFPVEISKLGITGVQYKGIGVVDTVQITAIAEIQK